MFIQLLLYIKLYVWLYLKDIYWFLICKILLQWAFTPLWCWWLNIFCYFIFRKIQLFIVCLLTVHKQDFAQENFNAKKTKTKEINTKVDLCRVFHTNCNCPEKKCDCNPHFIFVSRISIFLIWMCCISQFDLDIIS